MGNRLRLSGVLIATGLVVQLVTLHWNHPLSFLAFLFIGSPLIAFGIGVYLYAVLTTS